MGVATQPEQSSQPIRLPVDSYGSTSDSILKYPENMDSKQDRIKFTAVSYSASGVTEGSDAGSGALSPSSGIKNSNRKTVRDGPSVFLPIQAAITDNNSVDWQGSNLNEIERELANLSLSAMRNKNKNVVTEVQGRLGNIVGKVASSAEEIKIALAGEAVGIQNLLGRFGTVLNPNLELLFTGPQLRPFNFTFKLSPRSQKEATIVKQIINFFKKNMAARKTDDGIFLKAPYTFFIEYQNGTTLHKSINKIKECALTNCSVDYTPLGTYMTYEDSDATMVSYTLSLQFQELEPIYSDDYDTHPIGY